MEGIAAGSKVRTRQSHEGKSCAICAAADCNCLRIQSGLLHSLLRIIDQMHTRLNHLSHITILLFHSKRHSTFTIFFIEKFGNMPHHLLAAGKHGTVMVADDIVKACRGYISAHFAEMEKSLILFCIGRSISCWKHVVKLHGNQRCIDHGILTAAWMYGKTFDLYLCTCGIEVLVFNLILSAAVYSVGKISPKAFYIEEVCTTADLLIRGKTDADFSMRNALSDNLLCHGHDFCYASLVISPKKRSSICSDQGSAF